MAPGVHKQHHSCSWAGSSTAVKLHSSECRQYQEKTAMSFYQHTIFLLKVTWKDVKKNPTAAF